MTTSPVRPPSADGPPEDPRTAVPAEVPAVVPASREERSRRTAALLARAAGEDEDSRRETLNEVVLLNMGVADAVAQRFARRGVPVEDLRQVAYVALVRAVREFDPTRLTDLLSYAVPSMEGELRRYFRDHGWAIRPPREVQVAHSRLIGAGRGVERSNDDQVADLADEIDASANAVREALAARDCLTLLSLDAPSARTDSVPDTDDDQRRSEARLLVRPVVAQLAPRDREVLRLRFVEELTQREIAERIGASQVQVCRLLEKIIVQLRGALGSLT